MVQIKALDPEEPFDGVLPEDYPETYAILLNQRCFKKKAEISVVIDINNFSHLYCGPCFQNLVVRTRGEITIHRNLHQVGPRETVPLYCDGCKEFLQDVREVKQCGLCTEYILKKLSWLKR